MQPMMLSELAVSGYTLPFPDLAAKQPHSSNQADGKLAKLAEKASRARAALKEQRDRFNTFYRQAKKVAGDPDELDALASALLTKEHQLAGRFLPKIRSLQRDLEEEALSAAPAPSSLRHSVEEVLEVSISWLEQYQNLRIRLIKLASDRRKETEPGSGVLSTDDEVDSYPRHLVAG